ncbi:DUF4397 domain-containing protein [Romboutsia sp.]|uniref:DUF4397 domain-containing protein n=1 Tax=Romboutsia sp. TaxID=1965302 RepID=UPI003F3A00F9
MNCFKIEKNKSLVRMFNALSSNKAVDIYSDGILIFSDVEYKEFTSYMYVMEGSHKIDVYEAGTKEKPIIRTTIKLPVSQIFTIAITGNENEETLLVIGEDINKKVSKESAIGRTVNLAPDIPIVDLAFNEKPSVDNISYRDETPYVFIPPDKYDIYVKEASTGNIIAEYKFEFKPNRIYTLYIIGNPPNVELLQSVDGNTYACL